MSTLRLQYPGSTQQHLRGWAISFLVHGIAVGLSLALVTSLHLPPQPKVFKWDVAVVDAPQPTPTEQTLPPETKPAEIVPPPLPPAPAESRPPEPQQAVRTVQSIQPVQTVQQVVHQEVRSVAPVVQESRRQTEETPRQPAEVVTRSVQSVEATPQAVSAPKEVVTATDPLPLVRDTRAIPAEPRVESAPVIREASPAPAAKTVLSAPSLRQEATVEVPTISSGPTAITPQPSPEATSIPAMAKERASPKEIVAKAPVPAGAEKGTLKDVPVRSSQATRPDFGWLTEALLKSVEQRKGYPRQARIDLIEGKVTLRMVLKEDGRSVDLVDLGIEESSGHAILDRHALEVVRKAFPLELKQPLGQPRIQVHLPMTYRLDQAY